MEEFEKGLIIHLEENEVTVDAEGVEDVHEFIACLVGAIQKLERLSFHDTESILEKIAEKI